MALISIAACSGLAGCASDHSVAFDYRNGHGIDAPMLVGTSERVLIEDPSFTTDLPAVRAQLDDPKVATIVGSGRLCCMRKPQECAAGLSCDHGDCTQTSLESACTEGQYTSGWVDVVAVAPGNARLQLIQTADDREVDSVALSAAPAASLQLHFVDCPSDGKTVSIPANGECVLKVLAFDASGKQLQASGVFEVTTADPSIAGFGTFHHPVASHWITSDQSGTDQILTTSPGTTTLTVRTGQASTQVAIVVQ